MQIRIRDTVSFFRDSFAKTEILQKRQPAWQAGKNNLSDRIQVQIGSDVDAVVNDSSDPVDIEKESNQKEKILSGPKLRFFFSVPKIFPNV